MKKVKIKTLAWDTKQLGVRCGLIDLSNEGYLDRGLEEDIVSKCKKDKRFEFITIKLPKSGMKIATKLKAGGANLIGKELTFSFNKKRMQPRNANNKDAYFVFCKSHTSKPFMSLASQMEFSRFFFDKGISKRSAINLWKESIKNHCQGHADELVVGYYRDKPCGIVTLKFTPGDSTINLYLVGVLKRFRRKNIARGMLESIKNRYSSKYRINVDTYSNNLNARKLYRSANFAVTDKKYILHYWRDKK